MKTPSLKVILVAEGSSDGALEWPLRWLFEHLGYSRDLEFKTFFRSADSASGISGKIRTAIQLFEADLLFVHRDSDNTDYEKRADEIFEAATAFTDKKLVPLITVRMMEAWLLINEAAIRIAAGNPRGKNHLALPKIPNLERIADPKEVLFQLLKDASELKGRRLKKFSVQAARQYTAEEITDYSPLLQLKAFQLLKDELKKYLEDSSTQSS